MITAMFSEKPDKIRYILTSNGYIDIWLRTNITECTDEETGFTYFTAEENYFRVNKNKMSLSYVEENFEELLSYTPITIDYSKDSLEQRVADLEAILVELLGGSLTIGKEDRTVSDTLGGDKK